MGKKVCILIAGLMAMMAVTGCTPAKSDVVENTAPVVEAPVVETVEETMEFESLIVEQTDTTLSYKDLDGSVLTVSKNPKNVIVLYNSYLDLWYLNGGEAIARASGTTGVPEAALDLPEVGKYSKPNMEEIMALEPGLVIMRSDYKSHRAIQDLLTENNVEILFVDFTTYEEFLQVNEIFAAMTGDSTFVENDLKEMTTKIVKLKNEVAALPAPKTLILFATSKSLSCENEEGTTGHIVAELNGNNIIDEQLAVGETRVDFSLETIVERNPETIVIKTMGDIDKAKGTIEETAMANEAWEAVDAVINERVTYLSKDLFMYKPNERYFEAYLTMAKLLYPETDFSSYE